MRDILTELRPKTFSDFAGNEEIVETLRRMIAGDRVPSAILFSGQPGSGKTTLATILGRALSCENWKPGTSDPCGRCKPCTWNSVGAYPWNGYHLAPGSKPSEKAFAEGLDTVACGVALWSVSNRAIMTVDDLDGLAKPLQIILRGRLDNPWPAGNLLATSAEPEKLDPPLRQRMIEYQLQTPELDQIASWCRRMMTVRLGLKVKDKGCR
jgi:DNA polymerase III delta prime subunit